MPDLPWDYEVMPLPVQERHDSSKGGMQARQGVAQGDVWPDRRPIQVAIQVSDASVGLANAGVAGQVRFGARLAVAADPGVDQCILQILQAVGDAVINAHPPPIMFCKLATLATELSICSAWLGAQILKGHMCTVLMCCV